eukprot:6478199-Amphidinium_carterae.5
MPPPPCKSRLWTSTTAGDSWSGVPWACLRTRPDGEHCGGHRGDELSEPYTGQHLLQIPVETTPQGP